SIALKKSHTASDTKLEEALDCALRRNVLVVASAGRNAGGGYLALMRHHCVLPVVDLGRGHTPLKNRIISKYAGWRGLSPPDVSGKSHVPSHAEGSSTWGSASTTLVTGAAALLFSLFPMSSLSEVRLALRYSSMLKSDPAVPPPLDAW